MPRLILFLLSGLLAAQNGSQFLDWKAPSADPAKTPATACADLRALTNYEFSVATATQFPEADGVPAYCRVWGQILPQIQFEVMLPDRWNGRFYMFGNGGFAGESLTSPNRINHRLKALRHGFAVASTNTGHEAASEPGAAFASDRQKLLDYAFRSLHVTASTAKRVIQAYYGSAVSKSYFDGCSTGGRQGLILAQRFPEDFDGIAVGAPVLNFTGTMTAYSWTGQALKKAPVPAAKMPILASRIYAKCDAIDGLKDGLIDDPRRCNFSPASDLPKCAAADGPDCFTASQIETLEHIYADVRSPKGERLFPGWPVSAEFILPNGRAGWEPWIVNSQGPTIQSAFADTFFRNMAFEQRDPTYDYLGLNFDQDPTRLAWLHRILDATDPDLSAFRKHGGRIVMYYGWSDPALNAKMGVEYYEQVRDRMGPGATDFFRLFMIPGMLHCAGGIGTSTFDAMTPLVSWVERGKAPDTIQASRMADGKTVRTRPLCPYPKVAKYKGSGSPDDAVNFTCAAP